MKIPLYKLFLIQAAYALALGAFCGFGAGGIVCGVVIGTAVSGLILVAHEHDIGSVVKVAVGSFVGGCLGLEYLSNLLGQIEARWLFPRGMTWLPCAIAGITIGAVVGGALLSLPLYRKRKS